MLRDEQVRDLIHASEQLKRTLDHETAHLRTTNPESLRELHSTKTKHAMIYDARAAVFFHDDSSENKVPSHLRAALEEATQLLFESMQNNERALRDAIEINRRFMDILVTTFEDSRLPAKVYDAHGRMNVRRRRLPNLSVTLDQHS